MTENDHMQTFETDRLREICAVIATGIGKFVFMDWLQWQFPFIALSIISWISYIWYRTRSTPSLLRHWGFRKDNFARTLKLVLPFGLFAVGSFIVVGFIQDTLNPSWHIFPILIIYPVWGVIQQFLVIGLIAGNLQGMQSVTIKKPLTIFLTAVVFGVVHYPSGWLMAGTFILALFYGYVYLKERNLWVLGLFHGWLGGLFYYTVVNQDPFLQVFGSYLE